MIDLQQNLYFYWSDWKVGYQRQHMDLGMLLFFNGKSEMAERALDLQIESVYSNPCSMSYDLW